MTTLRFVTARRPLILPLAGLGLLSPTFAAAEPISQRSDDEKFLYQLVYEAPAECPRRSDFLAQVGARIGQDWLALHDQKAGTLAVAVSKEGDQYVGRMTVADAWGRAAFRNNLEGESCDAVLSDMAVAAVAAIESRLGPQPPYLEFGVSAGADWRTGLIAWGGGGLLGLRWPSSRRSLRLTLGYWATGSGPASEMNDVAVRFKLFSARVEFCPFELSLSHSFSFPLCAGVEAGLLRSSEDGSGQASRGWVSVGLTPKVRLTVDPLFFELGSNADLLLYPQRVTDVPPVAGQVAGREAIHEFPLFDFAVIASVGWSLR